MKCLILIYFVFVSICLSGQNKAIRFEENMDFVEIPHHSSLNSSAITIEFWLRLYDTGDPDIAAGEQTILDKRGDNKGYNLRLAGSNFPLPLFTVLEPVGSSFIPDNFFQSRWHHVAIAINQDSIHSYFDGQKINSDINEGGIIQSNAPLRIGQFLGYPGLDIGLKGELDEFRIWNHLRSPEEINENKHFELEGNEEGLIVYLDFNTKSGNTIPDASNNNNNGKINGNPLFPDSEAPIGYIPLAPPSYLLAYGENDHIALEWNQVVNVGSYQVFRSSVENADLNDYELIATVSSTGNGYRDASILENEFYFYYILPLNSDGKDGLPSHVSTSKTENLMDYETGVYYYPWYGLDDGGHSWEYHRGVMSPPHIPILGEHSSRNIEVINTHFRWMEEYSIDFLVSSWWGKDSWEDETLKNQMLPQIENRDLQFSIYFESPILGFSEEGIVVNDQNEDFLIDQFEYMADTYFGHPNYLKHDGKPVVFIYLARIFSGEYKSVFQKIRNSLSSKGHDVYLIGDVDPLDNFESSFFEGFVDAVSPYIMYSSMPKGRYPGESDFLSNASTSLKRMQEQTENAGFKYIPNIFPGFNDRAIGRPNNAWSRILVKGQDNQSFFRALTKLSRPFIDEDLKMIMITSWNEWHEDTQIEPVVKLPATSEDIDQENFSQGFEYEGYGFKCLQEVALLLGNGLMVGSDFIEHEVIDVTLFPNPTTKEVMIKSEHPIEGGMTIRIFSDDGRLLQVVPVKTNLEEGIIINIEKYPSGIYFAQLILDGGLYTTKFIIQEEK